MLYVEYSLCVLYALILFRTKISFIYFSHVPKNYILYGTTHHSLLLLYSEYLFIILCYIIIVIIHTARLS